MYSSFLQEVSHVQVTPPSYAPDEQYIHFYQNSGPPSLEHHELFQIEKAACNQLHSDSIITLLPPSRTTLTCFLTES